MCQLTRELPLIRTFEIIIFSSRYNIMLFFIPIGYITYFLNSNVILVFVMNFLAIISLGKLLEFAVNELSYNVNETLGGMLNMTFNNLVELIITILALVNSQIRVVQAAVLGSIFFHILLTFGSCFLFGGIYILKNRKFEQEFDSTVAQMSSSLMTLACITLALPASFSIFIDNNFNIPIVKIDNNLLHISYGTSIVLLVIYVLYLYFKLKTHKRLYKTLSKNEKEENEAHINIIASLILLIVMTVIVIFSAIFLIKSIDGVATSHGISKTFIGMILLPIAGNSVKYTTSVKNAIHDKMDTTINDSFGSSTHVALFIIPLLVILGWVINQPMSLFFLPFETICLFIAVILINYLVQDRKSNWLEGVLLIATYSIMTVAFFYYPAP